MNKIFNKFSDIPAIVKMLKNDSVIKQDSYVSVSSMNDRYMVNDFRINARVFNKMSKDNLIKWDKQNSVRRVYKLV